MMHRRNLVLAGVGTLLAAKATAQSRPEFYPLPVELLDGLDRLQGRVGLGNPAPDVHLVEFFDYNCGYCKRAARDIRPLLSANPDLRITLVNFASLGVHSVEATRVALAFSRQKADRYLDFHEALFARRGTVGAAQALEAAGIPGIDRARLLRDADSSAVTEAMKAAFRLGESFAFRATPSYIVGRDAFSGFLDRAAKQRAIDAFRRCERAACA